MSDELRIRETDITTDDGQLIHFAYDEEGDIMEIVFNDRQATCAVELTDNILLRFNLEGRQAIGLTFLDFSVLVKPTEIGPQSFPLTGLNDLPDDLRQVVVMIITTPPVNQFLKVSHFYASPAKRIPLIYVESPQALALTA